jgi:hypothetical protein
MKHLTDDQRAAACVAAFKPLADAAERVRRSLVPTMDTIHEHLDGAAEAIDAIIADRAAVEGLPASDVAHLRELFRMAKRDIERARSTAKLAMGRRDELAAMYAASAGRAGG